MRFYEIYDKATGILIMPIRLEQLHEVGNYTFDKYEYKDVTPAPYSESPGTVAPMFSGRRKLTKLEWRKLLTQEEQMALDKVRATVETMPLPNEALRDEIRTAMSKYNEATIMDLDDPDQERGFGLLVALGKMAPYRIKEILNG